MPSCNWDRVETPAWETAEVPAGPYKCQVDNIIDRVTHRDQDNYWEVRWRILEGIFRGRIIRDRLFFSGKAMPRAKFLFTVLGFTMSGHTSIERHHVIGRQAYLIVGTREYEWPKDSGKMRTENEVAFLGFGPVDGQEPAPDLAAAPQGGTGYNGGQATGGPQAAPVSEDDIPFSFAAGVIGASLWSIASALVAA